LLLLSPASITMARAAVFAALVLCLAAFAAAEGDVLDLTTDTFDKTIEDNEFVLVEFFAPWCGHCKKLAPEYAKAATKLKEDGIVLAAVDATVEKDLGTKFGVRGYPTLKLFKNGKPTEYKGGRTEDTIVSYMRKATGPPAKELASKDDVAAFIDSAKVVIVGYFDKLEGADYDTFIATAKADEDNSFGVTTVGSDDVTGSSGVVLYKKFDEGKNVFSGDFTEAQLNDFIGKNRIPLVIPFTMEAAAEIFQSPVNKIAFFFSDEATPDWYSETAKEYKGKFVFATSDSSQTRLTGYIGVTAKDFPVFYILETGGQLKKFPLEGKPDAAAVKAHLDASLDGKLKPSYKSEPVPEDNSGPVTVIVGKNFDEIVLDETKNVLLEVYAPWCGHCKKLEPIYNELGEAFANADDVVIAKMDGTENEVEGLAVKGFPTLKFFPKGAKSGAAAAEDYNGGRTLEDFKKFLETKAGVKAAGHDEL